MNTGSEMGETGNIRRGERWGRGEKGKREKMGMRENMLYTQTAEP